MHVTAIINVISQPASASPAAPLLRRSVPSGTAQYSTPTDTVELSTIADSLAKGIETSSLSLARTRAIRDQIARGAFETPERIEGTVERLLDTIG